ncbi:MAG TPA: hypothetical protein VGJ30_09490, partial [Candidatus Angelobacter sp.]
QSLGWNGKNWAALLREAIQKLKTVKDVPIQTVKDVPILDKNRARRGSGPALRPSSAELQLASARVENQAILKATKCQDKLTMTRWERFVLRSDKDLLWVCSDNLQMRYNSR